MEIMVQLLIIILAMLAPPTSGEICKMHETVVDTMLDLKHTLRRNGVKAGPLETLHVRPGKPSKMLDHCVEYCCDNKRCDVATINASKTEGDNCILMQCRPSSKCAYVMTDLRIFTAMIRRTYIEGEEDKEEIELTDFTTGPMDVEGDTQQMISFVEDSVEEDDLDDLFNEDKNDGEWDEKDEEDEWDEEEKWDDKEEKGEKGNRKEDDHPSGSSTSDMGSSTQVFSSTSETFTVEAKSSSESSQTTVGQTSSAAPTTDVVTSTESLTSTDSRTEITSVSDSQSQTSST